ncbi:unnamed protein product [Parnassius apollo]|uniref:(apollo) hypothetical protein n=1 Tax=Parnassius apollo TaxID=110799 RepID=A0A8S3XEP9_PARAO|nr:unnamed protein product [Parnassius apollo]
MSTSKKVILVTGASSGIGAAIAIKFSEEGDKVVLVGRNERKLHNVSQLCKEAGGNTLIIIADLTIDADIKRVINTSIEHFGRLDVLINNAGVPGSESILSDNAMRVFDEIISINLRAAVYVTHLAAPYLIKTKGNVINISSIGSTAICFRINSQYGASKAAIDQFTKCVALELATYGVRVNSVNPGPTKTDFMKRFGYDEEKQQQVWNTLLKATLLNKIIEPSEVADLVLFLASDKANSITGSSFVIDSGFSLKGLIEE